MNISKWGFLQTVDSQIQPILTYGSEIWGLSSDQVYLVGVHLSTVNRFIGASPNLPRDLIYGETGSYPLSLNTYCRFITFWLRITMLGDQIYPKKAYNMLLALQRQNDCAWACRVRNALYRSGFSVVWEMQSVANTKVFLREFKQTHRLFQPRLNASLDTFYFTFMFIHVLNVKGKLVIIYV